jgi:hypothetical protein
LSFSVLFASSVRNDPLSGLIGTENVIGTENPGADRCSW